MKRTALNGQTGIIEQLTRIEVFESTARIIKGVAGHEGMTIPDVAQDFVEYGDRHNVPGKEKKP